MPLDGKAGASSERRAIGKDGLTEQRSEFSDTDNDGRRCGHDSVSRSPQIKIMCNW